MGKTIALSVIASILFASGVQASEVTGQLTTGLTGTVGSSLTGTVSTPSSGGGGGGGGGSHSSHTVSKKSGSNTSTKTASNSSATSTQSVSVSGQVKGAETYGFARDLHVGIAGADVTELQTELIAAGYGIPAGATGYFGVQTRAAVIAWQVARSIVPAAGYFGPVSRGVYVTNGSFGAPSASH